MHPFASQAVQRGSRVQIQGHYELKFEAVRDACRKLKTTDLSGCDLYTSCEPCALCVSTMMIAGIGRMYYGASAEQSDRIIPRLPRLRLPMGC